MYPIRKLWWSISQNPQKCNASQQWKCVDQLNWMAQWWALATQSQPMYFIKRHNDWSQKAVPFESCLCEANEGKQPPGEPRPIGWVEQASDWRSNHWVFCHLGRCQHLESRAQLFFEWVFTQSHWSQAAVPAWSEAWVGEGNSTNQQVGKLIVTYHKGAIPLSNQPRWSALLFLVPLMWSNWIQAFLWMREDKSETSPRLNQFILGERCQTTPGQGSCVVCQEHHDVTSLLWGKVGSRMKCS